MQTDIKGKSGAGFWRIMKTNLYSGWLVVALFAWFGSAQSRGTLIVFDDAVASPFTSYWDNQLVPATDLAPHSGDYSVRRSAGTSINGVIFENSAGFSLNSLGGRTTVEFWVNSPHTNAAMVELYLRVKDSSPSTLRSMGSRGPGVTWMVDDVPRTGTVLLNSDSQVWQRVTFDLTQTYWIWNGSANEAVTLNPDEVYDRFEIRGGSLNYAPYLDTVRFIPEPGALLLLLSGGLVVLAVRRGRRFLGKPGI